MTLHDWKLGEYQRRRIAATLTLRKGVTLGRVLNRVQAAARKYLREYDANESKYKDIELMEWRSGKLALKVERRRHSSRGRVPRVAMRAYITALVAIHENATGKRVGRRFDAYREQETPHPFLAACVRAVRQCDFRVCWFVPSRHLKVAQGRSDSHKTNPSRLFQ